MYLLLFFCRCRHIGNCCRSATFTIAIVMITMMQNCTSTLNHNPTTITTTMQIHNSTLMQCDTMCAATRVRAGGGVARTQQHQRRRVGAGTLSKACIQGIGQWEAGMRPHLGGHPKQPWLPIQDRRTTALQLQALGCIPWQVTPAVRPI